MPIATKKLSNGITIEFHDRSNRYFGDYHRLCVEVRCLVPLLAECFADAADPEGELLRARAIFGATVPFTRRLEKMGVSGDALESTRSDMIDNFLRSSVSYLARADFPCRFIRREWDRKQKIHPLFKSQ